MKSKAIALLPAAVEASLNLHACERPGDLPGLREYVIKQLLSFYIFGLVCKAFVDSIVCSTLITTIQYIKSMTRIHFSKYNIYNLNSVP